MQWLCGEAVLVVGSGDRWKLIGRIEDERRLKVGNRVDRWTTRKELAFLAGDEPAAFFEPEERTEGFEKGILILMASQMSVQREFEAEGLDVTSREIFLPELTVHQIQCAHRLHVQRA